MERIIENEDGSMTFEYPWSCDEPGCDAECGKLSFQVPSLEKAGEEVQAQIIAGIRASVNGDVHAKAGIDSAYCEAHQPA